ncbi:Uncharacterised protein [Ewingella americana]|uniref:Uncharacterized protein n=1 Tax=Ewingella americana TaxID=41202 RepID=A0A377NE66_9GAMM|nr:Uncharacterised protein [Ewingella americana]
MQDKTQPSVFVAQLEDLGRARAEKALTNLLNPFG